MTKSALASLRRIERIDLGKRGELMARYDHLANAVAIMDCERLVGEIYKDGANLAAIVGIDGAWCVEDSNAALGSETAAWANLRLVALWQLDEDACRYDGPCERLERYIVGQVCAKIHACGTLGCVGRKRVGTLVDYLYVDVGHLLNIL